MARQPGIILYLSEYQRIRNNLTQAQKGDLLDALMDFGETGQEYQGDDQVVGVVFSLLSDAIRKAAEKYEDTCRQNADNIRKRWDRHKADTTVYDRIPANTTAYETYQTQTINTNTNSNTSEDQTVSKRKSRFLSPSVEEVKAYCDERQNGIDPEQFVDYYEARGWEVRPGQKMRDWKASVRTWEKNKGRWQDDRNRRTHEVDRIEGQREFYGL